MIGALGIIKAGAAYIPVRPGELKGRVDFQLDDAGAGLIVAGESWAGRGDDSPRRIVRLAQDGLFPAKNVNGLLLADASLDPETVVRVRIAHGDESCARADLAAFVAGGRRSSLLQRKHHDPWKRAAGLNRA